MIERILIAGSGGQGIVLAGKLLATAATQQAPHVTFFPAYGAEVRGGISNCQVILSSREIATPISEQFDTLIAMNTEGYEGYAAQLAPSGLLLVNSSVCRLPAGVQAVSFKATDMADELGDARAANLMMLGVLLRRKPLVTCACMEEALACIFAEKGTAVLERSLQAFRAGFQYEE